MRSSRYFWQMEPSPDLLEQHGQSSALNLRSDATHTIGNNVLVDLLLGHCIEKCFRLYVFSNNSAVRYGTQHSSRGRTPDPLFRHRLCNYSCLEDQYLYPQRPARPIWPKPFLLFRSVVPRVPTFASRLRLLRVGTRIQCLDIHKTV